MNLMKTLLPALINGFTFLVDKIITPISDFFNSKDGQNMMSAINKEVGLIFKSLGELFDEVKGVLGELFGTSKQSIGGQASGVIETIGARDIPVVCHQLRYSGVSLYQSILERVSAALASDKDF